MKPFLNKSILVTRPVQRAEELILAILGFGGKVIGAPMMEIQENKKCMFLGKGGPRRCSEQSSMLYLPREAYVIFSIFTIKYLLFSGSLESSRMPS